MNAAFAAAYATLAQRIRGWDYRQDLAELIATERTPREVLEAARLERLRELLVYCGSHVPFYREAFAASGFEPSTLRSEADLAALPIVRKEDLRAHYERFFADPCDRSFSTWPSSGSTGEPFPFRLDDRSITRNTFAALARGRAWWNIPPGARELMVWSGARDLSGSLRGRLKALGRRVSWGAKNIQLVDTYALDGAQVERAYAEALRFQPVVSRSISSGLYRFCQLLAERGLDGRALGIRHAIFTGEAFPRAQRRFVEDVLGCKTISEYGCSELGIIAFECPEGSLHLTQENLVFEYLQAEGASGAGGEAELIVTNLNDRVAPLVRYAVGDVVVPSTRLCPCGRTAPLIESVSGRTHAAIRTPAGGVIQGLFFTHLFDEIDAVHRFRVVQKSLTTLDLELTSPETIPADVLAGVRQKVADEMGPGVSVHVEQVADLPLATSGKFRWIVSEIEEG